MVRQAHAARISGLWKGLSHRASAASCYPQDYFFNWHRRAGLRWKSAIIGLTANVGQSPAADVGKSAAVA